MSQNGAIGMALEGFSYDEIIKWYYTDVKIQGFTNEEDEEEIIEGDNPEEEEMKPLLKKYSKIFSTNWLQEYING